MNYTIRSKGITLADSTKDLIRETIENKIGHFDSFYVEKSGRKITVTLKTAEYGVDIYATGDDIALFPAVNKALDIAKRKIRKAKTRVIDKKRTERVIDQEDKDLSLVITERVEMDIQCLDEDVALLTAGMKDKNVFIYRELDGTIVVLIKQDGGYKKVSVNEI